MVIIYDVQGELNVHKVCGILNQSIIGTVNARIKEREERDIRNK